MLDDTPDLGEIQAYRFPALPSVSMIANGKFQVRLIRSSQLPRDKADLAVFLSNYDTVILANVPAEQMSDEQQEIVRSNTYDQGSGLIMIGGPQSFGAGGWQNTEVEKALPVTMDIKSMKVESKSGLVLMMHASEMAEGNAWQRKIAKLAIERLSPMDMVGMLYFDHGVQGGHKMILRHDDPLVKPLQSLGEPIFVLDSNPTVERIARLIYDM